MRLSKSSILAYEHCPYSFYLSKIKKAKIPDEEMPVQLVKGTEVHEMLDDFYKPKTDDIAKLEMEIKKHKNYHKHETEINNFINLNRRISKKTKKFKPLFREVKVEDKDINILGFIDCVHFDGKNKAIIDYKTGREKSITPFRFELALYTYMFEKEFNQKITHWGLYFVSHDKFKVEQKNVDEMKKAVKKVQDVRKLIHEKKFDKCPGYLCKWCKYYMIHCNGRK